MTRRDHPDGRLEGILETLVERRIEESLRRVEDALQAWRKGERVMLAAHAEIMRHVARASALSERVARAGTQGAEPLLRDALELGVIDAAEFREFTGKSPEDVSAPPSLDDEVSSHAKRAQLPGKELVARRLLDRGPVLMHVDARSDRVKVPDRFRKDPRLVLRFGYSLQPPIPDLALDEEGLHATLTFNGEPFPCWLPWGAVYGVVAEDGRGMVWPDDMPPEVAREMEAAAGAAEVDGDDADDGSDEEGDESEAEAGDAGDPASDDPPRRGPVRGGPPRKGGHLKLVK